MATSRQQISVKTLEGEELAFDVVPTSTVRELRATLIERKGRGDPIEGRLDPDRGSVDR